MKADLAAYWPKLRSGGILAGHDYVDAVEIRARNPRNPQDWSREWRQLGVWSACGWRGGQVVAAG